MIKDISSLVIQYSNYSMAAEVIHYSVPLKLDCKVIILLSYKTSVASFPRTISSLHISRGVRFVPQTPLLCFLNKHVAP